ncbi:hypothetical protein AVEN_151461-1, partial [Araneus ventricosus]
MLNSLHYAASKRKTRQFPTSKPSSWCQQIRFIPNSSRSWFGTLLTLNR